MCVPLDLKGGEPKMLIAQASALSHARNGAPPAVINAEVADRPLVQ